MANFCPNLATLGGFGGNTETPFVGSQDGVCGFNSGETIAIPSNTDYAKLQWNASNTPAYPVVNPGNVTGLNTSVSFLSGQPSDSPYFLLAFHDSSNSLGQTLASDQILAIEFSSLGISGASPTNMTMNPASTPFVLYDNTQGFYLPGHTQANPMTLNAILGADPSISGDILEETWLAIGLSGGCGGSCAESLAVDSMSESYTPEPGTMGLMLTGLGAAFAVRRRRAEKP